MVAIYCHSRVDEYFNGDGYADLTGYLLMLASGIEFRHNNRSFKGGGMSFRTIRQFIHLESSAGIVLFVAAVCALLVDNSPWRYVYQHILHYSLSVGFGDWQLTKSVLHWVNEGLMTIFFFLVGLEVKRELFEGELNGWSKAMLPGVAAIGGMLLPALIYLFFNYHDSVAARGWAIPTATDIAFSLGILVLLGSRVPPSLKIFLTALAIFDDIGGIIIIAAFYTSHIAMGLLIGALLLSGLLLLLNRLRVMSRWPYFIVGFMIWLCVLKSGVHATLSGVVLAFAIPLRDPSLPDRSPSREVESWLHPWVAFLILPLFAFCNAGVSFAGMQLSFLWQPIPLGIILGLFVGKQIGVTGAVALAVKMGWVRLPHAATWRGIYGVALVSGVGFTMSLFIGGLAFGTLPASYGVAVRLGVLCGSFISGVCGYLLLRLSTKGSSTPAV